MNIYIDVEIAARELDSKLLLAVIAASRGHHAIVAVTSEILSAVEKGVFAPGIFHTKSLTPADFKISRHEELKNRGFAITSLDEEGGLLDYGYDDFARWRYSDASMGQASAVFCWGADDTETLKRLHPGHADKIHQTGSPRGDLWGPLFDNFWETPKFAPKKPFLLVSSNFTVNTVMRIDEKIRKKRESGALETDQSVVEALESYAENFRMISAFVQGIKHLAKHNTGYDIVLRPHPTERIELWRELLHGSSNVHVIRNDSITAWINQAFAVMHNGCTSAMEATVNGTSVVTYVPFAQEHAHQLPNELGYRAESPSDLLKTVTKLYDKSQSNTIKRAGTLHGGPVTTKIYIDDAELAAEKIVTVWESLDNGNLSRPSSLRAFQASLKLAKLFWRTRRRFRKKSFAQNIAPNGNVKFPPLEPADVRSRINRLQQILGLNQDLRVDFLSNHAVSVRPPKYFQKSFFAPPRQRSSRRSPRRSN